MILPRKYCKRKLSASDEEMEDIENPDEANQPKRAKICAFSEDDWKIAHLWYTQALKGSIGAHEWLESHVDVDCPSPASCYFLAACLRGYYSGRRPCLVTKFPKDRHMTILSQFLSAAVSSSSPPSVRKYAIYPLLCCIDAGTCGLRYDPTRLAQLAREGAELGSDFAMGFLAELLRSKAAGDGKCAEAAESFAWLLRAANEGHLPSMYHLGLCYETGFGAEKDVDMAIAWYRRSSERSDIYPDSVYQLGVRCEMHKDIDQAIALYHRAIACGSAPALFQLARCYRNGTGVEKNPDYVFTLYRDAAEQGHLIAQVELGIMYETGRLVEQDYAQALTWYRRAAEAGCVKAQMQLVCLLDTDEQRKNAAHAAEAQTWLWKAAMSGQSTLAMMQAVGTLLWNERDKQEDWLLCAAHKGCVQAMFDVGRRHCHWDYSRCSPPDYMEAKKWFALAMQAGHEASQFYLAKCMEETGGEPDEFVRLYRAAAERGCSRAKAALGLLYFKGSCPIVPQDYELARQYFHSAGFVEDGEALYTFAVMHFEGLGGAKDFKQGVFWMQLATSYDSVSALRFLVQLYETGGEGIAPDHDKVISYLTILARKHYADAQGRLAEIYLFGRLGVTKNVTQGMEWLCTAAKQGHAQSQYYLAGLYEHDRVKRKNIVTALELYTQAAEGGHTPAMVRLGDVYKHGLLSVTPDPVLAFQWFQKAAALDNAIGQFYLGNCYAQGKGVEVDLALAVYWWDKAAAQGNASAQCNLGLQYWHGNEVVVQDKSRAMALFQQAAAQDSSLALAQLGLVYLDGCEDIVERDLKKAAHYVLRAVTVKNSCPLAFSALTKLLCAIPDLLEREPALDKFVCPITLSATAQPVLVTSELPGGTSVSRYFDREALQLHHLCCTRAGKPFTDPTNRCPVLNIRNKEEIVSDVTAQAEIVKRATPVVHSLWGDDSSCL